jgi:hypothetical protein
VPTTQGPEVGLPVGCYVGQQHAATHIS